jgi:hypothetical protein
MTDRELDQKTIWLKSYCLYIAETLAFNAMVDMRNSAHVRETLLIHRYSDKPLYAKRRVLSFEAWSEYHSIYES